MRVSVAGRWLVMSCLVWLAACGSSGGSSGGGSGSLPSSHMSISPPDPLTVMQYTSADLVVTGTLSPRPDATGTIYISVVDDDVTFYAQADISGSGTQFTATLHSAPWLDAGSHRGTLTVKICQVQDCSAVYPGYSATVPYTVTVQPPTGEVHRLLPSALAVALADTPNGSVLSRTLWVRDNFGAATTWSASSDAAWLTVTPSGTADVSNLVISADPSSLPIGQTSVANVQITAPNVTGATIHVGLWRDKDGSTQVRVAPTVNALDPAGLARDPYRPLIYASLGNDQVLVYNAHTATLERTISGLGANLTSLAVGPDGAYLYALDGSSLQVIDLATDARVASWTMPSASPGALLVIHPNGEDIVLFGNGGAMARGNVIATATGMQGTLVATDDGLVAYSMDLYSSPSTITAWLLGYSSGTGQLQVLQATSGRDLGGSSFNGEQIAVAGDGRSLYVADATGGCMQVDPVTLAFVSRFAQAGGGNTTGVAMGAAGNVACGYSSLSSALDPDLAVFSPAGAPLSTLQTTTFTDGMQPGKLAATADGLVAVGGVQGMHELLFAPMGQPPSDGSNLALGARTRPGIARALANSSPRR